tara:strand:+ start:858 stop:2015 length:1158 start_codon:yes stop_codon:yes gene_type:complete
VKVLLGQLGSNGDCLYATVLAHQVKHDFPDCHLTWAISGLCKSVLRNNPHVDEIWEIPVEDWSTQEQAWYSFEADLIRRQGGCAPAYDKVILSQIWPNNFRNFDGSIRPSILRAYGAEIAVPVETVIALDDEEVSHVEAFRYRHQLERFKHVILFESFSKSGQSYVTPEFAIEAANRIVKARDDTCVIVSSHLPFTSDRAEIIDGSGLTMRESAGLTHHCTLFIGCGSGLTVIATSQSAKVLPNIQLLKGETSMYASFAQDFDYFGRSSDHFVEMHDVSAETLVEAVLTLVRDGVPACRTRFHQDSATISFDFYTTLIDRWLLQRMKYADAARSTLVTAARYGWHPQLLRFARYVVAPKVLSDPTCRMPDVEHEMKQYLDTVWSV